MLIYDGESSNPAYGQILIDVESFDRIEPLLAKIQNHIDSSYPDSLAKVWKFVLGPGGGSKIEARFEGPEAVILRQLSDKAKSILADAGAISIKDDWSEMIRVIRPEINEENARRLGLTQGDISKAIAGRFDGTQIGVYREGDELRKIIFRPTETYRDSIDRIKNVQILSPASGKYVPIAQVVDGYEFVFENGKMRRFNRALAIQTQADPAPGVDSTVLFSQIQSKIESIPLPDGYTLTWRGEHGNSSDANAGLAATMPLGIGAMVVVVFLLFNAVRQPVIIWLTVPLALIGVVYGLIATGTSMEFMAILAVLSLTGMSDQERNCVD